LQSGELRGEFIAGLWNRYGITATHVGFLVGQHRLSFAISIRVDTNHRPVIDPLHRLQMNEASVGAAILEVNEP
jgi:hypothetical protein